LEKWKRAIILLDWAERRWRIGRAEERALEKKRNDAAKQITDFFRVVIAKNIAYARKMALEQAALEERMALRVQCAWRCRQGRFSLYLKRLAKAMRDDEERIAAIKIQKCIRGYNGRKIAVEKHRWKINEAKAKEALGRMFKKFLYLTFSSWQQYANQMANVKRMLRRTLMGVQAKMFIEWRENVTSLINAREEQRRRDEELRRAELRRKRKLDEDEKKILAALKKMRNRVMHLCFDAMVENTEFMRELKRRIMMHMIAKERNLFQRWIQYVKDEKQMRADAKYRAEMEHKRWLAEQKRLEEERERKVKRALNRMFNRILASSFVSWSDYAVKMKRMKQMMKRALLFKQRQRFDLWWEKVLKRREQFALAKIYLARLLKRHLWITFEAWMGHYRQMQTVKKKMRLKLMGKKQYFLLLWQKGTRIQEVLRLLTEIGHLKRTRTRLVGLSKARIKVLNQTMELTPDEYEREDLIILREALHAVTHFQELENRMALRVQCAWRGRKGRLAYQMKMFAKRERDAEMLAATLKMQRLLRGWIGRKMYKKRQLQKKKDDMKKKYILERKREEEREKWYREAEEIAYRENLLSRKAQEEENERARLRMEKAKIQAEEARWAAEQKRLEAEAMGWGPSGGGGFGQNNQQTHPSGWMMIPDDDNNIYYYNTKNGASQWERPAELGGPETTNRDEAWIELPGGDGKTYWFNTITNESTWDNPMVDKDRIPEMKRIYCETVACLGHNTTAVRKCKDCNKNFCLACYVEEHRSSRKEDHSWQLVLQPSEIILMCSTCTSSAEKWCPDCNKNYCDNCFLWEHSEGIKKQHQGKSFIRGSPVCVECENRIAEVSCHDCMDVFCRPCYASQHRSGTKKNHTKEVLDIFKQILKEGEEYCLVCEIRPADRACDSCGDPYCKKCFEAEHSRGNRADHTWTPWKKLAAGRDWVEINDEESGRILYFNVKTRQTTDKKPVGLMSGKERASQKKRQAAEREMKIRLEKEAELIELRRKVEEMEVNAKQTEEELYLAKRARAPEEEKKKGWFGKKRKTKAQKKEEAKLKKGKMKEFLKDRLITEERQKELDYETKQFGSELYERSVLNSLTVDMTGLEDPKKKKKRKS
jgi:hypothetical protein